MIPCTAGGAVLPPRNTSQKARYGGAATRKELPRCCRVRNDWSTRLLRLLPVCYRRKWCRWGWRILPPLLHLAIFFWLPDDPFPFDTKRYKWGGGKKKRSPFPRLHSALLRGNRSLLHVCRVDTPRPPLHLRCHPSPLPCRRCWVVVVGPCISPPGKSIHRSTLAVDSQRAGRRLPHGTPLGRPLHRRHVLLQHHLLHHTIPITSSTLCGPLRRYRVTPPPSRPGTAVWPLVHVGSRDLARHGHIPSEEEEEPHLRPPPTLSFVRR